MKALLVVVVLATAACGGNPAQTQVRIVIQSDLGAPDPIRRIGVFATSQPFPPGVFADDPPLPFLLAVTPGDQLWPFSVRVELGSAPVSPDLLLVRGVRDVPFVKGEGRMLVLRLLGKCACHGTSCPSPGDPDCADLVAPALMPADDVTAASPPDGFIAFTPGIN